MCSRAPGWPAAWAPSKVTTLNLKVVATDAEKNLLLVKGAVPGPKGGLVVIRDAVKAATKGDA